MKWKEKAAVGLLATVEIGDHLVRVYSGRLAVWRKDAMQYRKPRGILPPSAASSTARVLRFQRSDEGSTPSLHSSPNA